MPDQYQFRSVDKASSELTNPRSANAVQMSQVLFPPVKTKSAWRIASLAAAKDGLQGCNFIPSTRRCASKVFPIERTRLIRRIHHGLADLLLTMLGHERLRLSGKVAFLGVIVGIVVGSVGRREQCLGETMLGNQSLLNNEEHFSPNFSDCVYSLNEQNVSAQRQQTIGWKVLRTQ